MQYKLHLSWPNAFNFKILCGQIDKVQQMTPSRLSCVDGRDLSLGRASASCQLAPHTMPASNQCSGILGASLANQRDAEAQPSGTFLLPHNFAQMEIFGCQIKCNRFLQVYGQLYTVSHSLTYKPPTTYSNYAHIKQLYVSLIYLCNFARTQDFTICLLYHPATSSVNDTLRRIRKSICRVKCSFLYSFENSYIHPKLRKASPPLSLSPPHQL